jgi:hypothetical protein
VAPAERALGSLMTALAALCTAVLSSMSPNANSHRTYALPVVFFFFFFCMGQSSIMVNCGISYIFLLLHSTNHLSPPITILTLDRPFQWVSHSVLAQHPDAISLVLYPGPVVVFRSLWPQISASRLRCY